MSRVDLPEIDMRIPRKRTILLALLGIITVSFLYVTAVFTSHGSTQVRFENGDRVEMKCASIIESISGAGSEIHIRTSSQKEAHVVLYQDLFNSPVMVIPATAPNVFFCLYDYDVDIQLLKLDLNEDPQPSRPNSFVATNVIAATCKADRIDPMDVAEWKEVSNALRKMSTEEYGKQSLGVDLLFRSLPMDQGALLSATEHGGSQGTYGKGF